VKKLLRLVLVWLEPSRAERDRVYSVRNKIDFLGFTQNMHLVFVFLKLFSISGMWEKVQRFIVFPFETCRCTYFSVAVFWYMSIHGILTYRYSSCAVAAIFGPPKPIGVSWKKNPTFVGSFWRRNLAAQGVYQLPPPHMCAQSWTRDCLKGESNGAANETPTCAVLVQALDRFSLARQGVGEICFPDSNAQTSRRELQEVSASLSRKNIPP